MYALVCFSSLCFWTEFLQDLLCIKVVVYEANIYVLKYQYTGNVKLCFTFVGQWSWVA